MQRGFPAPSRSTSTSTRCRADHDASETAPAGSRGAGHDETRLPGHTDLAVTALPPPPDGRSDGAPVDVPDDARDLERDRVALERERAAARRRARLRRLVLTRRWETHGVSGPLIVACLALVAVAGSGLALLVPRGTPDRPRATPLASPAVSPGLRGGLLPDAVLAGAGAAGGSERSRDMRPGVVLLVGPGCEPPPCRADVNDIVQTARASGLRTWLVADNPTGLVELAREDAQQGGGYAVPLADPRRALTTAYPVIPGALTLLVVDTSGVVRDIVPGAGRQTGLLGLLGDTRPVG